MSQPRQYRLLLAASVLLAVSLAVPDDADGKHKRPKRRNGIAQFDLLPAAREFTCVWSETPFHDYGCNPGFSAGTPAFGLLAGTPETLRPPHALQLGGNYPHNPDVDGWGGPFPLASPEIALQFSCQWAEPGPPTDDPARWQCSFTYNAHTHRFRVSEIVSVAYERGSNATRQWFVPCDRVGPCPEEDPPPNTRITSGPPRAVASTAATLRFVSSERGSTFQCRLGSAAFAPCTSPLRLGDLPEGRHSLRVRAVDDRGKLDTTPARRSWRTDTTGPRIRISGRRVRLSEDGGASVRLRCLRTEASGPCSGRLRLATRRGARLGSKRFKLVPGRPKRVRVMLSRGKRALVAGRGQVRVRATVRARDRLGNLRRSSRTFTLRAP